MMTEDEQRQCLSKVNFITAPAVFSFEGIRALCKVVDVYDGDTLTVVFWHNDFHRMITVRCRMLGYDSDEIRQPTALETQVRIERKQRGIDARDRLRELTMNQLMRIELETFDKYGRVLVRLYDEQNQACINDMMCSEGFVKQE